MEFLKDNLQIISIVVSGFTAVLTAAFAWLIFQERSRENSMSKKVEMEKVREMFERGLYDINSKIALSAERWKDINHLLLSTKHPSEDLNPEIERLEYNTFLKSYGISPADLEIEPDLVFVLMPFHTQFREFYDAIKITCEKSGFRCLRGDESITEGDLFPDILRLMVRARCILTTLDGRNPNVFYELGIAHALGKQVIMTAQNLADVPFDVRSKRIIIYSNHRQLHDSVTAQLSILKRQAGVVKFRKRTHELHGNVPYVERLRAANLSERLAEIDSKLADEVHRIIDDDFVVGVIAGTNATGWHVDDYSIKEITFTEQGECQVFIDWHATGDQDDDKPYHGTAVSGSAIAIISEVGHVRFNSIIGTIEQLE